MAIKGSPNKDMAGKGAETKEEKRKIFTGETKMIIYTGPKNPSVLSNPAVVMRPGVPVELPIDVADKLLKLRPDHYKEA